MSYHDIITSIENERVLVLERIFDAPRDLVFKMFKEAKHLKHWWGPVGWDLPVCNIDFHPGGKWHYCMKCMDKNQGEFYGQESWGMSIYEEINEPKSITYTDYFSDAEGKLNEELPSTKVQIEFIDLGGKTKLVNRSSYNTAEALNTVMKMGMLEGITETWNRLEDYLNSIK